MRPPPTSTLFPYTTLFRSGAARRGARPARAQRVGQEHDGQDPHGPAQAHERRGPSPRRRRDGPDRKSTRLNSSHEWISYAVFCLKKKKTPTRWHLTFVMRL